MCLWTNQIFIEMQIGENKLFNLLCNNEQFHVNLLLTEDMQNISYLHLNAILPPFPWKVSSAWLNGFKQLSERKPTISGT